LTSRVSGALGGTGRPPARHPCGQVRRARSLPETTPRAAPWRTMPAHAGAAVTCGDVGCDAVLWAGPQGLRDHGMQEAMLSAPSKALGANPCVSCSLDSPAANDKSRVLAPQA
jgi:hypothetical protein